MTTAYRSGWGGVMGGRDSEPNVPVLAPHSSPHAGACASHRRAMRPCALGSGRVAATWGCAISWPTGAIWTGTRRSGSAWPDTPIVGATELPTSPLRPGLAPDRRDDTFVHERPQGYGR